MLKSKSGFTLVELLIVIVVIGILAAITLVAYNGVQQKARDSARKSDVAAIAKLYKLYNVEHAPISNGSGCGSSGNGNGWFNYSNGTTYPTSIMDCLKNSGVTSSTIIAPSGLATCSGTGCDAYLVYTCIQGSSLVTYIYANLETGTHTGSELTGTCGSSFTSYGMNYYAKVVDS